MDLRDTWIYLQRMLEVSFRLVILTGCQGPLSGFERLLERLVLRLLCSQPHG